jgi:hypothetical protein
VTGTAPAHAVHRHRLSCVPALLRVVSPGGLKARRRLRAARRAADEELLGSAWASPLLAWRVNEVVARKNRLDLARSVRGMVRDADPRLLPGASPLNRGAVRTESELLQLIAERLEEVDADVAPRGVLLVERLLVDGYGPLYARERADELHGYLQRALAALEPR